MEIQRIFGSDRIVSFQFADVIGCCNQMEFFPAFYCHISSPCFSGRFIYKAYPILQMDGDRESFICLPCKGLCFCSICRNRKARKQLHGCRVGHFCQCCFDLPQHIFGSIRQSPAKTRLAIIKIIHQIMLHRPCLGCTPSFFHDLFDVIAVERAAPSGTAIPIEECFPEILIIAALIQLDHVLIGSTAGWGRHGMLHTIRIDRISLAAYFVTDIFIGVIASASHNGIERMKLSVRIVIISICFNLRGFIP